jgi:hypothetical protein
LKNYENPKNPPKAKTLFGFIIPKLVSFDLMKD